MANTNNQDFLLIELNGDMLISNGDFSIGPNVNQNISDILLSNPQNVAATASWQQYPNVGCALEMYQNGQINGLSGIIRKQLLGDGINIDTFNVSINANSQMDVDISGHR